ncbi:hypothetical protein [Piscinibacter sp.]|uniref:hypothetical protein n=1 Tax=Piscinibacter sp. TaxID=1903157 RepID=UPI002BB54DB6|nr:hypothetical protein [Albitalea sp.]HUG26590.1 hypothetical protein [Albitalea sp.]
MSHTSKPAEPADRDGLRKSYGDQGFSLFLHTVTQAGKGVDLDFLRAPRIVGTVPKR